MRLSTALVIVLLPLIASAQLAEDESLEQMAGLIARSVIAEFDCEIELIGRARTADLLDRRYIAYSASGTACDSAAQEMARQGTEIGIQFLRRPSLGQLRALLASMIRSIETTSRCRITLSGTPSLDEATGQWFVGYLASGNNCDDATRDLGSRGEELEIVLIRRPERPTLLDDVR